MAALIRNEGAAVPASSREQRSGPLKRPIARGSTKSRVLWFSDGTATIMYRPSSSPLTNTRNRDQQPRVFLEQATQYWRIIRGDITAAGFAEATPILMEVGCSNITGTEFKRGSLEKRLTFGAIDFSHWDVIASRTETEHNALAIYFPTFVEWYG
jgi:hypothetical protein